MDATAAAVAATLEAAAHVQVFQGSLNESYNAAATAAAGKKSYKATTGSAAAEQSVEVAVKGREGNARKVGQRPPALNNQLRTARRRTDGRTTASIGEWT